MKNVKRVLTGLMVGLSLIIIVSSCDKDENPKAPLAFFSFAADADNSQLITFTNETESGDSYVWDFGDGSATSTDMSPTHEYADGGDFTVTLTATNKGGDNVYTETITVLKAAAVNLIENGTFENETGWTIFNVYECTNDRGLVTIADGKAKWTETATASDGGWKHMAIYQELTLEAGTYNLDMFVEYAAIADIWGEAYIGSTPPVDCTTDVGTDYTDNRVLVALTAWDCNQDYSGSAVANNCNAPDSGVNGQFTIDADGTYFFVFKVGGGSYGTDGVTIDDITLFKQ